MHRPRLYTTCYYFKGEDKPHQLGHACSEVGALRAAIVRIFLGQYHRYVVHKDGVRILTIVRRRRTIATFLGAAVPSSMI